MEFIESSAELSPGNEERFSGYGVMALMFASGHVVSLRRFSALSSKGITFETVAACQGAIMTLLRLPIEIQLNVWKQGGTKRGKLRIPCGHGPICQMH